MGLYGNAIDKVVSVSSSHVVGATNLPENIFRSVNIAFVNERKLVYESVAKETADAVDFCQTFIQCSALNSDGSRRRPRICLAYQQFGAVNNVS
ncbi:MAG TPA: hypothetical protein VIP49_05545 [Candidatus Udaeobacter sp.]